VIFASFKAKVARLSHGAGNAGVADKQVTANTAHVTDLVIVISGSSVVRQPRRYCLS
jgi:hypothetical protein